QLRQLFMQYEWPGNIRELENMIKRVVILQDEQLVIREIERNMQRALAAAPVPVAVGVGAAVPAAVPGRYGALPPSSYPPPAAVAPAAPDLDGDDDAGGDESFDAAQGKPADGGNGSLAAVAKAASMKAERAAIETTLRQVHWNRRKAAQILG